MLTEEEYHADIAIIKYVIKKNRGRLGSYGIDFDEALSIGLVGLATAIKDYETKAGSTSWFVFAYEHIWKSIFQSDLSTKSRRRFIIDSGIKRIRNLYFQKTGRQLTDEHLAYLLDANETFPKILRDHFRKTNPLPYTVNEAGEHEGIPLADARVLPEPENTLNSKSFVETVQNILNDQSDTRILTDDERYNVKLYFGVGYPRSHTFREIALLRGCGFGKISRQIKSSLEKLKCDSRLKELHLECVEA